MESSNNLEENSLDTGSLEINTSKMDTMEASGFSRNADEPRNADDLTLTYCNVILFKSGYFFTLIEKFANGSIIASCSKCGKKIKGKLAISSNFITHLKSQHPDSYKQFMDCKNKKRKSRFVSKAVCKQNKFNKQVVAFIASTISSLSIVDNKEFIKLFDGTGYRVPSRGTVTKLLSDEYEQRSDNLKKQIANVKYFCTTADIWSAKTRSFFGYTLHWLDENFERESAAIACRRFAGVHSFDKIASTIADINKEFNLTPSNIVSTITDNASNFLKAFREFGLKQDNEESLEELQFNAIESTDLQLPHHFKCACHTLNLISSSDFLKIIKKEQLLFKKHNEAMSRCESLWRKCHWPKSSEIIKECLGSVLIRPVATRWNSIFNAITNLLKHKTKLDELCDIFKLTRFRSDELAYLEEYVIFMEPIAGAINYLQYEKNMYFGYFLPTVITIKVKYEKLICSGQLKLFKKSAVEMEKALLKRFEMYYLLKPEVYPSIVATATCPDIKSNFIPGIQKTAPHFDNGKLLELLTNFAKEFESDLIQTPQPSRHNFFDFGDTPLNDSGSQSSSREISNFLSDGVSTVECLNKYPIVKKLFIKYNSSLPSSAPVERLFSFATMINAPKRQGLSDSNFEKLVILKSLLTE